MLEYATFYLELSNWEISLHITDKKGFKEPIGELITLVFGWNFLSMKMIGLR